MELYGNGGGLDSSESRLGCGRGCCFLGRSRMVVHLYLDAKTTVLCSSNTYLLGQNLDKPETFCFLMNQVDILYISSPDDDELYAWLIVPLRIYVKQGSALTEAKSFEGLRIESKLVLKLLAHDPESRLVIYLRGNAGTMGQTRHTKVYRMVTSGALDKAFVLCFDYCGLVRSTGSPTEIDLITDAISTIGWGLETARIMPSRFVLLAQSLGTWHRLRPVISLAKILRLNLPVFFFAQRSAMPLLSSFRIPLEYHTSPGFSPSVKVF